MPSPYKLDSTSESEESGAVIDPDGPSPKAVLLRFAEEVLQLTLKRRAAVLTGQVDEVLSNVNECLGVLESMEQAAQNVKKKMDATMGASDSEGSGSKPKADDQADLNSLGA